MRISVKGRYALAALVEIARNSGSGENVAVISISQTLGISKIYLEQVFAQLKKSGILVSVKGSRGGYQLARPAAQVTVWEALASLEAAFVERTESTVNENAPEIEAAMETLVFKPLDEAVRKELSKTTVQDLLDDAEKRGTEQAFMMNM